MALLPLLFSLILRFFGICPYFLLLFPSFFFSTLIDLFDGLFVDRPELLFENQAFLALPRFSFFWFFVSVLTFASFLEISSPFSFSYILEGFWLLLTQFLWAEPASPPTPLSSFLVFFFFQCCFWAVFFLLSPPLSIETQKRCTTFIFF